MSYALLPVISRVARWDLFRELEIYQLGKFDMSDSSIVAIYVLPQLHVTSHIPLWWLTAVGTHTICVLASLMGSRSYTIGYAALVVKVITD